MPETAQNLNFRLGFAPRGKELPLPQTTLFEQVKISGNRFWMFDLGW
jgi:hypothetical protein